MRSIRPRLAAALAAVVGAVTATFTGTLGAAESNADSESDVPSKDADGWPDASDFLDKKYGFLPVAMPITEPAVGYGAAGGVAFLSRPLGDARAGLGRPNMTFVGGMGTENKSWGTFAGDMRHWLDDRVQTLVGMAYVSVKLDFHGLGENSALEDNPIRYTLEPAAFALRARYRFGDTLLWAGASYAFATTEVLVDAPDQIPSLPDYDRHSRVGGITPSAAYDSRDNMFTPTRGSYLEASCGVFGKAFGGQDSFQRASLTGLQYFALPLDLYLGFRGDATAAFGDAPFYLHPYISLRGVPVMRYQGEEIAQFEAELRWQFWGRLSVLGFGGVGSAWNDFEHVDDSQSVFAGGAGMRYELASRYGLHMGVDVAGSRDTTAFYIQVGSAWMRP